MVTMLRRRPPLLTLRPRPCMWGPTFTMALAGLAHAIMDRVTTDLASTAVVITAVTGAGNYRVKINRSLWSRLGNDDLALTESGQLLRPASLEGILQQGSDAFPRDGARIVIGVLYSDVRRSIQIGRF
jgi:hypothetical protein